MFLTWSMWGLLLVVLVFNSFYNSFIGQQLAKHNPSFRPIELRFAQRQQRWSGIALLMVLAGGYFDWRWRHHVLMVAMSVALAITTILIGMVYHWHESKLRELPEPPIAVEGEA